VLLTGKYVLLSEMGESENFFHFLLQKFGFLIFLSYILYKREKL